MYIYHQIVNHNYVDKFDEIEYNVFRRDCYADENNPLYRNFTADLCR